MLRVPGNQALCGNLAAGVLGLLLGYAGLCQGSPGSGAARLLSFHSRLDSEPPSHFLFSLLWLPSLVWLLITHLHG